MSWKFLTRMNACLLPLHRDELKVQEWKFVKTIKVDLKPATGEDTSAQWVCMELWFYIPVGYPDTLPEITIKNPRGLSDQRLQQIEKDLQDNAQSNKGMMMLYHLIEVAKDHLTKDNLPACACAICLYGFDENDVFVKTACFHYFHSHCLSRYVNYQLDEIREKKEEAKKNNSPLKEPLKLVCPMCRLEIPEDIVSASTYPELPLPSAQATDPEFTVTPELEQMRKKMARLYLQQKERGGIIDVEGEKNKFFIQISNGTEEELERSRPTSQPAPEARLPQQSATAKAPPKSRVGESSDSDSDSGGRGGRGSRGRRGKSGRMYPTPAEKKRAHLQALQQMKQNEQTKIADKSTESTMSNTTSGAAGGASNKSGGRHRATAGGCANGMRKAS
ncbi:E3 ubiquitin-protein ligase RNF25-like isoform X3 [Varroa destructor]|uniref:E3 ubiquitin-protein ligase RNF25 n=1 Tax=Varroa destructor TaxID=109461 RepID=A0A7M7L390_VARDE|nr:E3 ubiquitin-protein ligase RNF25-like isoform X3 [Varroa destructor]